MPDETQDWTPPKGEAAEIETFPIRVCECGAIHDRPEVGCPECKSVIARDAFEAIRVEDHAEAMNNARHERNFWSWKYSRRQAECEELAERLVAAEAQRDDLLKAIEEHRDELSNGPTANKQFADDRLYSTATRIEEEAGN
jgi:hypothetical protein